jgi:pSer/pThr/pTyr-binding forkhead associated (FHA) protein/S1-C subfamily serine protease
MQKIIINHLIGSKANQTEIIEFTESKISFGRDKACQVVFDPEKDDLVSRVHCKIDIKDGNQFILTDLDSRNGTFVNHSKISSIELFVGDKVQLGKGGPEFSFDLDPKPQNPKHTRLAENMTTIILPATRLINPIPSKNTVERMITQSENTTRKKIINIGAGVVGVISLALVYFGYQTSINNQQTQQLIEQSEQAQPPQSNSNPLLSASEIFKQYGNSTVLIEASWTLIHTATGKQVFQRNECFVKQGKCISAKLPWYIQHNGVVEPYLDIDSGTGIAIGNSLRGSGFVAHENGFVLTNRHVAANWHAQIRNFQLPGILVDCNDAACSKPNFISLDEKSNPAYLASLNQWIPSKTKMLGQKPLYGKIVEGRNDYLEVTFPKTGLRIPAHVVRVSDIADVAMIKIDLPNTMQPVQLSGDAPVSPGDNITVMGYPGISPEVVATMKPQDPNASEGELRSIPEPTVTNGNIGKVINSVTIPNSASVDALNSSMGDVYQLTVNATGSGNSGGPVFNDKGQVIGLFTYGMADQSGIQISFAVPIKYGQELMSITAIK